MRADALRARASARERAAWAKQKILSAARFRRPTANTTATVRINEHARSRQSTRQFHSARIETTATQPRAAFKRAFFGGGGGERRQFAILIRNDRQFDARRCAFHSCKRASRRRSLARSQQTAADGRRAAPHLANSQTPRGAAATRNN